MDIDLDRAMDIINKRAEPKDDAELAEALKVLAHDPDGMSDIARAAWWEQECHRVSNEEAVVRLELSKLLRLPASWKYLMPRLREIIAKETV